jgi:anti-sigma B factor antagonist
MDELVETDRQGADLEIAADSSGVTVLELSGEIDISTVGRIREAIEPMMTDPPGRIVFDLARLRFIDSSGLTLLLAVAERVPEVELRHPSPLVRKLIEITGVTDLFDIRP